MRLGAGGGNGPRRRRGQWAPAASGRRVATEHQRNEGGFLAHDPIGIGAAGGLQATVRPRHARQRHGVRRRRLRKGHPDRLCVVVRPRTTGPGTGAGILPDLLPPDERAPRLRRLPDSRLVHITDLYTDEELKTSAAYNELLPRARACNSINVRLDGPDGSRIVWVVNDPVDGNGWSSAQLNLIQRLLPHIRQCVRAQQALAGVGALGASMATLLDTTGLGIVQLDGRGRIVAANDRARDVIRMPVLHGPPQVLGLT